MVCVGSGQSVRPASPHPPAGPASTSALVMVMIDFNVVIAEKMTVEVRSGDEMLEVDKVECKGGMFAVARALSGDSNDVKEPKCGGVVGALAVKLLLLRRQLESRARFANPLSGTI